jgi:nucleoid-associated protein YgaU
VSHLLAWVAFLGCALAGLHASSIPATDGVSVAFAAMRVGALVIGWYLLVVTAVGLVLRALRLGAAIRVADLVTVPLVRRLVHRAASVAVAASFLSPAAAHAADRPVDPPPVMRLVEDTPAPADAPAPTPAPAPAPSVETYEVRPGDNLWSVTEHVLAERLGRAPTDAEVVPVWHALIAANVDRVRDPSLVFAGQVLRLPAALSTGSRR